MKLIWPVRLLLTLLCLPAGLAACDRLRAALPLPDLEQATATATPAPPTFFPQPTLTQRRPTPSTTATPTHWRPTPRPSITPTSEPTLDLVATAQAAGPADIRSSHVSPDSLWWARVFSHPCPAETVEQTYGYDYLLLTDQQTGEQRTAFSQLISCGGLGAYGLEGLFWSPINRFFYFTDAAQGVPDGCGYWEPPLLRLDMNDWSITRLGAGAISPDRFRLAAWLDGELVLWDLNGERLTSAPPPVSNAIPGPVVWSPDGKSIAYLLSEQYCPLGVTYLVRVNLADFQPVVYHASQDPSFASLRWDIPNRVILTDENGAVWAYNFITGDLSHYNQP